MALRPGLLVCCQLPWMLVFLSFEIASCCVAQDDLKLVFFLTSSLKITGMQHHTRSILGILNSANSTCSNSTHFQRTQKWLKTPATIGNSSPHPELTSFGCRPFPVWRLICIQPWYRSSQDFVSSVFPLSSCLGTARHWANQLPTSATTKHHLCLAIRQQPCLLTSILGGK